jgi:hypothetical protein
MKSKFAVSLAVVAITGLGSSYTLAAPKSITLGNGHGTLAGEFKAKVVSGTSTPYQGPSVLYGANTSFITFCLEKNEYFDRYDTQTLYVKGAPNTGAMNGGGGRAAMYVGDVAGSAVSDPVKFDPISSKTAYLYTQFSKGTLSNYDYGDVALRVGDADALQNAFWYLENELGNTQFTNLSGQTQLWINEATNAIANNQWSGIGNVRVLNLYKDENFTQISQDQLYMVPEPETYAMMLAGLGLIGFFANRRRRKVM